MNEYLKKSDRVRKPLTNAEAKAVENYEPIVEEVINRLDPMGFFPDAPANEYAPEIRAIALRAGRAKNIAHLAEIIYVIFAYYFEEHFKGKEVYMQAAKQIAEKGDFLFSKEVKMGVYDTYGKEDVQLKVGPCELKHYNMGDAVPIPDGIYIGWEGFVIIQTGLLIAVHPRITTKYGEKLSSTDVMDNPIEEAIEEFKKDESD